MQVTCEPNVHSRRSDSVRSRRTGSSAPGRTVAQPPEGPSVPNGTQHARTVPGLDRAIGDRTKNLRSRWSGDTHMQEPVCVQVRHALENLLNDGLDLFLVESYPPSFRGARTPLEDAQQRAALNERGDDGNAGMIRRQCKGRENAMESVTLSSPGTHRSTLGCLHSPSRCASRISCDRSVLETLTAHGLHSSVVESGSLNTAE